MESVYLKKWLMEKVFFGIRERFGELAYTIIVRREEFRMKIIRLLLFGFFIFCSTTTFAQGDAPYVRLKHNLPNVMKVTNVRVYSDSSTSAKISIWISVKKGKIVSVGRSKGDWIITLRTRGSVSTYVVSEKSFKIAGEESKSVKIRAMHFIEGG